MSFKQVKLPLSNLYMVFEDLLGFTQRKNKNPIHYIVTWWVTFITTGLYLSILWPFFVFRYILNIYLSKKYKSNYVGMLSPLDSIYESNSEKLVIYIALLFETKGSLENLISYVTRKMRRAEESCSKLTCSVRSCLGYRYYLQTNTKGDISEVSYNSDDYLSKEAFLKFFTENCLGKYSVQDNMWHATVLKQPISLYSDKRRQYAIIVTIRHCIGDGVGIIGMIKNTISEDLEFLHKQRSVNPITSKNIVEDTIVSPSAYVYKNPISVSSVDYLETLQFTSKEFLSIFLEDSPRYVTMIKDIKNKLKVQFDDVLIAGVATAISEYARKKNLNVNSLTGCSIIRPFSTRDKQLFAGDFDFNRITNKAGLVSLEIPIRELNDLVERVLKVNEIKKKAIGGAEILVRHVVFESLKNFPAPFLKLVADHFTHGINFTVTNVSGMATTETDGKTVDGAFFFTSQFFNFGFCCCVHSMGDKLQVALKSKKGIVETREELNEILNNTFGFVDALYEEVYLRT